jgi:hypothetical protein
MCPAANQARPGEGAPGVGQAVGERGVSVGGSAEAPTAARLPRAATPLGRRGTFAWICHSRRMGKDHERLCSTGEAFVYAAMTRLMVRRMASA